MSTCRLVFSDPANAEGELPASLPACIDWSTLRLQAGSFVDDELRARHLDVLHSVTVAKARGAPGGPPARGPPADGAS